MYALAFFMILLGVAFPNVVIAEIRKEAYKKMLNSGEDNALQVKENKWNEQVASIYFPIVLAIYFAWSFSTEQWQVTWMIWPIAALGYVSLVGLIRSVINIRKN